MRSMQLARSSLGASFFRPIRRRASTAVRSQGSVMVRSVSECQAALAWLRTTDQAAAVAIDPDCLASAMRPFPHFEFVAQFRQARTDVGRYAVLDLHLTLQRE